MKKLIFFLIIFLFSANCSWAQEKNSEEYFRDLAIEYRLYQGLIEPYNIAKSRHETYQSVSSRAEYIEEAKKLLTAETKAIASFANFIRKRLVEATSILIYKENLYFVKIDDELAFLSLFEKNIAGISSIAELQERWAELRDHYQKISSFSYLIKSHIETGSLRKVFDNLKITREKISEFLSADPFDDSNTKAAKDKFKVSEKEFNETVSLLTELEQFQTSSSVGSSESSAHVRSKIETALGKIREQITNYRDIIFALTKK